MANLNKVMLIGRLTRDPEERTFSNGGKVANIGFAVNNRKKNQQSGEWEDVPVWLDVKAFNRDSGRKLADLVMNYLRKGSLAYIEGHLVLEEWEKDGQKRNKLVIHMDDVQFLQPKGDGSSDSGSRSAPRSATPRPSATVPAGGYGNEDIQPSIDSGPTGEDIPF
jgi:single-strand DNA-binding protein